MLANFSIIPLGGGESVSKYVAKVIDIVDRSGLNYQLTSMGTLVEGNWDEVMGVIKKCHNVTRRLVPRVYTVITIDDRKGAKGRLTGKVKSVERVLKREVRK
ncbi:MAG: hypothetical protein AMJ41_00280 [candidate division Zixibacteria bacterium DG_27]|nr:MAG: hypothetical protein AMJ41_00280 [candidate division Zixibacteria bacterium DG_27]